MICFHHNDADGRCAGAVVNMACPGGRFVEMDYDKQISFADMVQPGEEVIIVDFSFKPDKMEELEKITNNIIWIDHHKTILDHPFNTPRIEGIRDIEHSGCYWAWRFYHSMLPMPMAVELISDYDTWTLAMPDSKAFRFGLDLYDHGPTADIWVQLLSLDSGSKCIEIVQQGETVLKFIGNFGQDYIKSYGFKTEFECFQCIAQGVYGFGSTFFGDLIEQYDICIAYEFNGRNWIVGLYSVKTDVSVIAKKYGGGGHKGAAGFVCSELPF